jgi:hypothetical protein
MANVHGGFAVKLFFAGKQGRNFLKRVVWASQLQRHIGQIQRMNFAQ